MALIVDAIPIISQNHTLQKLYTTSQMGSQPVVICRAAVRVHPVLVRVHPILVRVHPILVRVHPPSFGLAVGWRERSEWSTKLTREISE
jgi:hypothetical protein